MSYLAWTVALLVLVTTATLGCPTESGQRPSLSGRRPNIFLIVGDDMGWCDYSLCDKSMATPAISALAERGLTLTQHYTLQACTPTRSVLLTGRYAHAIGMQAGKIKGRNLRWLNETLTLIPETLQDLGYATHAVGKWHLGFCNVSLTPTYRGFQTFYGFLSGAQGYFTHSGKDGVSYDFRDGERVAWEAKGKYSTELHTLRVQEIIRNRTEAPLFIYIAFQNAHDPWEAHPRYTEKYCSHVKNETRRIHCSMVAAMDEGIGNITETLRKEGIFNNSMVVYFGDNGGPTGFGSYNWPFRGRKGSLWEGGVHSFGVISYPEVLTYVNTTWDGLMHVSDWYPTIVSAAGGNVTEIKEKLHLDGFDQLYNMALLKNGSRTKMVINIDDRRNRAAVRMGNFKLLRGKPGKLDYSGWIPPPYLQETEGAKEESVLKGSIPEWQLFNIYEDPSERKNLIDNSEYDDIVAEMKELIDTEEKRLVPFPDHIPKERFGNPKYYGGVWSPGWCSL